MEHPAERKGKMKGKMKGFTPIYVILVFLRIL
jgi:hypothetical protein